MYRIEEDTDVEKKKQNKNPAADVDEAKKERLTSMTDIIAMDMKENPAYDHQRDTLLEQGIRVVKRLTQEREAHKSCTADQ